MLRNKEVDGPINEKSVVVLAAAARCFERTLHTQGVRLCTNVLHRLPQTRTRVHLQLQVRFPAVLNSVARRFTLAARRLTSGLQTNNVPC